MFTFAKWWDSSENPAPVMDKRTKDIVYTCAWAAFEAGRKIRITPPNSVDLGLKLYNKGGKWLGAIRDILKWRGGDRLQWGSPHQTITMSVQDLESAALKVATVAIIEYLENEQKEFVRRAKFFGWAVEPNVTTKPQEQPDITFQEFLGGFPENPSKDNPKA